MRKGFTTGSCAAAAAKAAAYMLLSGNEKTEIGITLPGGETYHAKIEEICRTETDVRCGVRKDAGDDPDVTNGTLIVAKVTCRDPSAPEGRVEIRGGQGVGKVTRPGLDQPVGSDAINSVPRAMIEREVLEVMELFDISKTMEVEISVPEGEALAAKTFNPRLGIEGGISIIGTTGIVEPMSTKAVVETIRLELTQKKKMGASVAIVSPGNYGLAFMKDHYGYDLDKAVKCANRIGEAIDLAAEAGFEKMLLCGHIGKLIKVAGGIMNTHSKEADCRMELMAAAAIRSGADAETLDAILNCVSTEEAIDVLVRAGIRDACMAHITERIGFYLNNRAAGRIRVEAIVYANAYGLLGKTEQAEAYLNEAKKVNPKGEA